MMTMIPYTLLELERLRHEAASRSEARAELDRGGRGPIARTFGRAWRAVVRAWDDANAMTAGLAPMPAGVVGWTACPGPIAYYIQPDQTAPVVRTAERRAA